MTRLDKCIDNIRKMKTEILRREPCADSESYFATDSDNPNAYLAVFYRDLQSISDYLIFLELAFNCAKCNEFNKLLKKDLL